MQLLLCAATEFEIKPVVDWLQQEPTNEVDVLFTGVGILAATYSITKSIASKKPDFILQAGIAGCLDYNLPLSKVVLVENESVGDLGVNQNGKFESLFELNFVRANKAPWKNGKLYNNLDRLRSSGLTIVDGVTVNEISTNKERIAYYREQLNVSVETMEGAALHYVAINEGIPFLQIRSLSNFVGERDKGKWVMDVAIANLNIELKRILTKMLKQ